MLRASFSPRLVQRVSSRAIATRITPIRRFNSQIPAQSDRTPERRDRTRSSQLDTPVEPLDLEHRGSRTIRVGGAALKPNSTGYKKITAAFKGYGRIRDVRFVNGAAYVDFLHPQDAAYVLEEHQQQPFAVDDKALQLALAAPGEVPLDDVQQTVRVTGVSVRDPAVRRNLSQLAEEKWEIKLSTSVMEGGTEQPLGYVAFSTPLDARMAFEYFSSRFPQADVQYVGKIRDDEAFPPNDTLSIGGFKGSKYEFRRCFHDFRNEIIDVRRTAKHTDADSWEFVFIQFSSIDVAWRVKAMLEEKFPETLRVRFSGQ